MPGVALRSLLFTDIEGSTSLLQRLGPRYAQLLADHHEIVRSSIRAHGGDEQGTEGDSFFVTFESASAALAASVDAQRALTNHDWPADAVVRVRMGMHAGEVAAVMTGLVGLAIHHAARIAASAHGGQIVISDPARLLLTTLPSEVGLLDLGVHSLRDVGPITLHQVLHPALLRDFPPLRAQRSGGNNLPAPLTTLIGRDAEAAQVSALIQRHRVVTLSGAGGSGKSRLALRVASEQSPRFSDGVWSVELATAVDETDLARAVVRSMRLDERVATTYAVAAAVEDRQLLVVLDNCEHLLDACVHFVEQLTLAAPQIVILATSREPLGVAGEAVFRVPSLSTPSPAASVEQIRSSEAVALFVDRVALRRVGTTIDDADLPVVADICRQLDGIPLAIELAAARAASMSTIEVHKRLHDRFRLLTGGPRGGLPRHQTLRATVDWSYQLLSEAEQTLLTRLAVFRGGATLDAIERICAGQPLDHEGVVDTVFTLEEKSLVDIRRASRNSVRVRLPETIRQYAADRLVESDAAAVRDLHAEFYRAYAASLAHGPGAPGGHSWIDEIDAEIDNLEAATEWLLVNDPDAAARLLVDTIPAAEFTLRGPWRFRALKELLEHSRGQLTPSVRARALVDLAGGAAFGYVDGVDIEASRREAQALLVRLQPHEIGEARAQLLLQRRTAGGDPITAEEAAEAVAAGDASGGLVRRCGVRLVVSLVAHFSITEPLLQQAATMAERADLEELALPARLMHTAGSIRSGRPDSPIGVNHDRHTPLGAFGLLVTEATAQIALLRAEHGDHKHALLVVEDAVVHLRRAPTNFSTLVSASYLAWIRLIAGDISGASDALGREPRTHIPSRTFMRGLATIVVSALARHVGDPARALDSLARAGLGPPGPTASDVWMRLVEEAALVAADLDATHEAAALLRHADNARRVAGYPRTPYLTGLLQPLNTISASPTDDHLTTATPEQILQRILRAETA